MTTQRLFLQRLFQLTLALWLSACGNVNPEFTESESVTIPQPTIQGQTSHVVAMTLPTKATAIQGECDPRIQSLEIKMASNTADGTALTTLTDGAPTLNCQNNSFRFKLMSLKDMKLNISKAQKILIEIRGFTTAGFSKATTLTLDYSPEPHSSPSGFALSSGGGLATTPSGLQVQSRLTWDGPASQSSLNHQVVSDILPSAL